MRELRVAAVVFEDGLEAWQERILTRVRALEGVQFAGLVSTPRGADTDFAGGRRSGARAKRVHENTPSPIDGGLPEHDLVLNLTRATLAAGGASNILALDFDDDEAPGRREAKKGAPVTAVRVRRDGGGVLAKAVLKTAPRPARNADKLFNESALLFERAVRMIRDALDQPSARDDDSIVFPSGVDRLKRRVSRTLEKMLFRTRWTLALTHAPVERIVAAAGIETVRPLRGLPADRFYADPFPLRVHGRGLTILAESAALKAPHKGHICTIDVSRRGEVAQVRDALRTPEHLSFPFLLREGGDTICMPECHEAGALRAFKVGEDGWSEQARILDGVAVVDPVLFQHDGKWWLFCGDRAHEDTTHLFLFVAEDWRGPWRPHTLNPIKSDVRSSRPAGAIIAHEGALYRPAQDCSQRYGGALSMQRIKQLSETAFEEEEVFRIDPRSLGRRYLGVHTLNGMADMTVLDVLERRLVFT